MPIYEYKCAGCGHRDDHLQKIAESPLTKCPACGKKKYQKQLSAAGFQLKGSGWYATDFKGGTKPAEAKSGEKSEAKAETKSDAKTDSKAEAKTESKKETKTETKPEKKTPASTAN